MKGIDHLLLGTNPRTKREEIFIPLKNNPGFYEPFHDREFMIHYTAESLEMHHKHSGLALLRYERVTPIHYRDPNQGELPLGDEHEHKLRQVGYE